MCYLITKLIKEKLDLTSNACLQQSITQTKLWNLIIVMLFNNYNKMSSTHCAHELVKEGSK